MTLELIEMKESGPSIKGKVSYNNGTWQFDGIGKSWYDGVREDFSEAPQDPKEFMEWADRKFDGNYFAVELI